jgi:hypothetical protein
MPMATVETRRPGRRATWIAGGALVLAAVAIFALTYDRSDRAPSESEQAGTGRVVDIPSNVRHRFANLDDLVGESDLVVSGRVVATEPGRIFGTGEAGIRSHVLTVRVDSVLAGSERPAGAGTVVLVEEEAELADGTPVRIDGMRASEIGDDGIWFLAASGDPDFPGYAVINSQGRYLVRGDALQGGDADDELVQELEVLDRAELERRVREAA